MNALSIEKYQQNYIKEGCISVDLLQRPFVDFDRLRLESFPSLRSVDFMKVDKMKNTIVLVEITELSRTVRSLIKMIKKEDKIKVGRNSYIIVELLKAEYREKFFESLFLFQLLRGAFLKEKRIYFFIVLCDAQKHQVFKFRFLEEFLSSLLPSSWRCKILLAESFVRKLKENKFVR